MRNPENYDSRPDSDAEVDYYERYATDARFRYMVDNPPASWFDTEED